MNLLDGLNPQQSRAVTTALGPVLVLAGPGSGKTRVLTQSIAYRIGQLGARPYNILSVTFTNKAAREMEARVENLLGDQMHGLTLGTFHGICVRILRREAEKLPFTSNFVIFDADDQVGLVKQALRDLDIDEKQYRPRTIHGAISRAKNELILAEDFPIDNYRDEITRRVYEKYQELLLESNAVDFDDLLLWTATLIEQYPVVREKYARRYEHILVDEFQDTNMAQYQLLQHLASYHNNIFAVGDADQSIYRWRGADYRNVSRFEQDFPDAQVILLEQNYRSTQNILNVAMDVINKNKNRTAKELFSELGAGQKISVHEAYGDREEAQYVVDTIASQVAAGSQPGDFAIMYRTNAQSRVMEEAFIRAGLPYKLVGAQKFYGRKEIKDMVAYLRLVHNPSDAASLMRVINVPTRKIGKKSFQTLRTVAQQVQLSPGDLLLQLARGDEAPHAQKFSGRAATVLGNFGALLQRWCSMYDESTPVQLMDQILDDIDYQSYLDTTTEEGLNRWENVMELRRVAADYAERGLLAFLEDVALISDQDTIDASANAPTLLTLHAAKGLEYPTVFIVGLEDGTLPHSRSFDDPEGMAEERRLFYVGITRAARRLFLLYAESRATYGHVEPTEPSRFLNDISPEYLNGINPTRRVRKSRDRSKPIPRWGAATKSKTPAPPKRVKTTYRAGMKVRHPKWGDGMVLNSRVQDGDETVDIFFAEDGLKRVDAALANLKILGD